MKIAELLDKRSRLIADARKLVDNAEKDKRDKLNTEEQAQFDAMMNDADALRVQADGIRRLESAEAQLGESTGKPPADDTRSGDPKEDGARGTAEYRAAFNRFLRTGIGPAGLIPAGESRALQADDATKGGTFVAPLEFARGLIKAVDDAVYIRQWARTFPVTQAEALGSPTLDTRAADAVWGSEIGAYTEDDTMRTGLRELFPHPLTALVKLSRTLMRKSLESPDALVRTELAYAFARTEEKGFLNGTGANQPLGVFTASAQGVTTARDVSTDNTATAVTFDGLINAKYFLKPQYWGLARWLGHRDLFKMVAKIKDAEGQYIWRDSVQAGEPDRLLGIPAFMSEFAPNTFTTGQYVGILGDFSHYRIADSLMMDVQVLAELYAANNLLGYIARLETDGMPDLAEAFVRVKLG